MSETVRGRRKNGRRGEKKTDLGNGLKMVYMEPECREGGILKYFGNYVKLEGVKPCFM